MKKVMMPMEKNTEKKSNLRLIIIILLVVVIVLTTVIGYFLISGQQVSDVMEKLNPTEEHTVLLKEFLVNLKFENNRKNYLKVQLALMYTDKKQMMVIDSNTSKIRDVILFELRKYNAEEILDSEEMVELKKNIIQNLNIALDGDIIKDVYVTDLVIQ